MLIVWYSRCCKKEIFKKKKKKNFCKSYLYPLYLFLDVRGWDRGGANDRRGMLASPFALPIRCVSWGKKTGWIGTSIQVFGASSFAVVQLATVAHPFPFSSFQPLLPPFHSFSSGTSVQFMDWFRKEAR